MSEEPDRTGEHLIIAGPVGTQDDAYRAAEAAHVADIERERVEHARRRARERAQQGQGVA